VLTRCRGIACEADEARRDRARTPRAARRAERSERARSASAMDGANNARSRMRRAGLLCEGETARLRCASGRSRAGERPAKDGRAGALHQGRLLA